MTPPNLTRTALEATARPWHLSDARGGDGEHLILAGEGFSFGLIAAVTYRQDAALIMQAVNERDALLASLESERAVLAQAKGALQLAKQQMNAFGYIDPKKVKFLGTVERALTAIEAFEKGEGK